jgi:hypothetical protein
MGILSDHLEAEVDGRLYSVRGNATLFGGRYALSVDGRKVDQVSAFPFTTASLQAVIDGALVVLHARLGLFGVRYRLFVGDREVPLRVETGESSLAVDVRVPRMLAAQWRSLPPRNER